MLLFLALSLGAIQNVILIYLNYIYSVIEVDLIGDILFSISDLLFSLELIALFVFVERIRYLKIHPAKIIILTILLTTNTLTSIYIVIYGIDTVNFTILGLSRNLAGVFVFGSISKNFYEIYTTNTDNDSRLIFLSSLLLTLGYVLYSIDWIINLIRLPAIGTSTSLLQYALSNIANIFVILGFAGFVIMFYLNSEIIYRSIVTIQDLIIFTGSGVSLYGIGKNVEEASLDSQLLSGFITAMNNFVTEMKPEYNNETIQSFQSSHRSIDIRFGDQLAVAVVVGRLTYIIRQKLQEFITTLEKEFELDDFYEQLDDVIIREKLKITFPYLEVERMDTY